MIDYPAGQYSPLLVGHQWPCGTSQSTTNTAATNRTANKNTLETFSQLLKATLGGPLANQEGVTADDIRLAFQKGEKHAQHVAEKNETKANSYKSAHQSVRTLREELSKIAKTGNDAIENAMSSAQPAPMKVTQITDIIIASQTQANGKAAEYCENIYSAIQSVLTNDGRTETARAFVKGLGIDLDRAFTSPDRSTVQKQVEAMLLKGSSTLEPPQGSVGAKSVQAVFETGKTGSADGTSGPSYADSESTQGGALFNGVVQGGRGAGTGAPSNSQHTIEPKADVVAAALEHGQSLPNLPSNLPNTNATALPLTDSTRVNPSIAASHASSAASFNASAPSPSAPSPMQAFTPEGLAQSFNTGMQSGGPISAGTEALSHNAFDAISTPVHHQPEFSPPPAMNSATTTPTAGSHFAFETAAAPASEATTNYIPPAQNPSAFYAAPMPAAPMPTAPPVAPVGPLPAYGADLRPPISTPVAPPPSAPPLAPSPASAPVSPAAGAGSLNQSSVVRQQPTAPNAQTPAVAATEHAVAAATAGALTGAASGRKAARTRLQSLIEAVARQEPKLRWAIGDREDGTTILTTDLASGWIPPHVEIPSGVEVLPPARRRGGLEAMLGDATNTASWTPGQYLPSAADVDPVPMSFRSRQLPGVDDLNWELTQAANWRDGLPRLAHTLAKAGVAGTGILESEADLLREHLHAIGQKVLESYADTVATAAVANWQLLAAIDALIGGRKTELNYHFAWFQALSMAKAGSTR